MLNLRGGVTLLDTLKAQAVVAVLDTELGHGETEGG